MRTFRLALLVLPLASFGLLGCGGGGGGTPTPPPTDTDFVVFFTNVFRTTNVGTDPVLLTGTAFTNRFPADETVFDPLLP